MRLFNWLVATIAVCVLMVLAACTVKSPYSGRQVTREELSAEAQTARVEAQQEAEDAAADLERQQRQREAAFQNAVARLNSETQLQVQELASKYEQDRLATHEALAKIVRDRDAKLAQVETGERLALAELDRRENILGGVLDIGMGAVAGSPIGGMALGGLTVASVLGNIIQLVRGKKREDGAWDEATAAAEAAQRRENQAWDESQAAALQNKLVNTALELLMKKKDELTAAEAAAALSGRTA